MATGSVRSLVRSIGTASKAVDITSVDEQPLCKGIYIGNILGTWYFSVGAGVARQTATLALSTAIVTVTSTSGYFVGSTLTKTGGAGEFGTNARITSIDSDTQFTATVDHERAGAITFSVGGKVVKFQGTEPGTVLPIKATTASRDAGVINNPTTGQIIFLY